MLKISTRVDYSALTLWSSGKKSFENMGLSLGKSGDTVARLLAASDDTFSCIHRICTDLFKSKKKLYLIIDDTLIKKVFAEFMEGAGRHYDTKMGRRINAYKLVVGSISDGKINIPIECDYLFSPEIVKQMEKAPKTKEEIAQAFVLLAKRMFPNKKLIVLADGLYATVNFFTWCIENKVNAEMRMHNNRVVIMDGQKIKLSELLKIDGFKPDGRRMVRTFSVTWNELELEVSLVRRIDKHGQESFIFQGATYKARPSEHMIAYKNRWPIEKAFRTTKQQLGLQECFSTSFATQRNHVAAIFLAYVFAQLEMKKRKLNTPEAAIRQLKQQSLDQLIAQFSVTVGSYQC